MAEHNESNPLVSDALAEEKLVEMWPDYLCLFDVRSPEFKDRDKRQKALEEIAKEINQNGLCL